MAKILSLLGPLPDALPADMLSRACIICLNTVPL
jgi:hypothetical protein